ncbi:MAG: hypothetical protein IT358_09205, partial [Gemmatimonadaceae bacterium]|nr:hypothetical protein [Gemmatimonadaceae bacterium]
DSLHLIRNGDGSEELYDVVRDGEERTNLSANRAAGDSVVTWLRSRLPATGKK